MWGKDLEASNGLKIMMAQRGAPVCGGAEGH